MIRAIDSFLLKLGMLTTFLNHRNIGLEAINIDIKCQSKNNIDIV